MVRVPTFSLVIMLFAGSAMATPDNEISTIEQQQALQAAMDSAFAKMMEPGPKQDGWDKGGIDIFKLVAEEPGGSKQNYLLTVDKDGERSVTVVGAGALAPYVPMSWSAVLHAGISQQPDQSDNLTLTGVDGPFYLAGWDAQRKVEDAFCSTGRMGGFLYEAQTDKKGEVPREFVPIIFNSFVKRLQDQSLCWRYDRQGDGFRTTYFLEDGRTLPALNAYQERVTIIKASSIEALLNGSKASE